MGIKAKADKIAGYVRDYGLSYAAKKVYYRYKIKYRLGKKYFPFEISETVRTYEQQYKPEKKIKVSIVVPLYNTPINFLKEMCDSVMAQTYFDWELCLADASDENHTNVRETVEEYMKFDKRIKYKKLEENNGISENTNKALEMVTGDYIGLMDHDDLLHPSALYNVVKTIENNKADFIYTDELSFDGSTDRVQSVHFKPDFSWETFRNNNFICHFTVFKKSLLEKVGGFRKEFDGSQDYDLFFRILEQTTKVQHIQKILYYWRIHKVSTASGIQAKPYIVETGKKAIEEHLKRINLSGTAQVSKEHASFYKVRYNMIPEKKKVKVYVQEEVAKGDKLKDVVEDANQYDVFVFVRNGYQELKMKENREIKNETYNNLIEELLDCIVPNENMASSNTVIDSHKRYLNAGWCYDSKWKEKYRPLYKGVPLKEPGYMNRLHFRQSVSLLDGSVLAIKTEVFKKWAEKKSGEVKVADIFNRQNWFEMCMEVNKMGGDCVLSPYYPAIINDDKRKEIEQMKVVLEPDVGDRFVNNGMEKFGREYFLW